MATSQYSTTSETTNAGRASRVLLGPCSAQLRDLLRDHVPPQKFPQIIRQKMANHKWTKLQRDLILPSTGQYSGNYSDFDISLLYTLLRNLCKIPKHKNGWGNDPDPNDMSLAANIERIRICRNRVAHALDFSLSDLEFNDIWSSISTAVIEMDKVLKSNHKHEKDVEFLRYEPMDSEIAKHFNETLRKQYEEDLQLKSLLSEHIKSSDQHIKRSDEKLDDMKSLIVKEFECTKAMIRDQQRRNTSIGDTYTAQCNTNSVQPTNQFLGFIHWILTVFGIMRILNFFWKKEELMELEAKEISYSSVLLQWENTINQRDNSEVLYLIEYGITRTNHAEEKIRVNSCAFILENLKHSTEYEVQVKAVSPSGEKQHSKKIKFKTEALGKLEYTEITETSILLKWEPKKHTRGEDSAYFVEYETTQPDIKTERVEVKSCEYRLEKLRHSTEYRVQIKVKTDSGETEHTDKIIFETRRHTARGLSETEIQTFERDLKKSKIRLKNVRLMAIGHQGVGKTTLLHRLRNLDSNPSEAELSTISPTKSIKTDLNYAVCNKRGDIICLGEDDICRRKLGMSLEEKEKQTAQKKEVKKSNEDVPLQGDTSSYPAKDTKSEKTIQNQTSPRLTNEDTATEINTDSSFVEDVKTDEYTDQTPSEIASQRTHANESEESEKKKSVIGDELAQDLGKILKEAQVGTDDEFFISYWDFAGEDAYHDTHVAFMSSDAVYLLLFNAAELVQEANGESKRSQEEHLRFWLQNIASLRSENISTPPVIVIGTHMDELDEKSVPDITSKVEDIVRQLAKDQGALENLYKIYLKNLKRDGITDIWEGIKCAKEIQEHWNKEVPSKMQILEYILTLEKKKTNSSYSSSTQDIRASWNKIGDTSEVDDDLNLYLKMLSDSGSILFLEHDNNVVLDISWIIKCFANIFAPSKEISEATKCRLKEPRIHEDVFREVMLHDEKGENITLKSFLTLGLMVKSNGYITVPAYLPQKRDELVSMREIITKNKKTQKIEISSKLSIFFERKNAAKVNIPLSTLFFNSILVVLIDSLQRKGGGKTLSRAQKSTCLTSIRRTSGILDDNQVYGLIYEMKEGTLYLLVYSLDRDSLPTNLLQDIISKINMLNYAYHKKPLEMKFEISEGYTVPFKSEKANEWMQHWTSKCSTCGKWKDIAYQTGQDISFIDDEGWLKGREDLADVVFKCMKCFKSDDDNKEITSHRRQITGSKLQHLVLSERFLVDLASQIGAEWQLLFIGLGLTNTELEHIDYDHGFNQVTKNLKAFLLWRKKNKDRQASEQLRILFEGFQEIGRQDLVDKYTEYLDDVILISAYESSDDTMAASKYPSTPEISNINRASRILLGPCTDQLRDVLRHLIPPANFHKVITRNISILPRLIKPQRDLILPRSGRYSGDYSDMDISLLYLLLRNICHISPHTKGWGNTPDVSDSSLSASIDRIRKARNEVVHPSSNVLTQIEFYLLLAEIKMAVIAMDSYLGNINHYEKAVDFLLTETMDPEQDVFIQQLKKQVEEEKITKEIVTKLEKQVHEDISTINEGVERLDRRVKTLERGGERLDRGVERLDRGVERLDRGVEKLDRGVERLDTRVETLERGGERLDRGVEKLDTRVERLDRGVDRLDIEVKKSKRDIENIRLQVIEKQSVQEHKSTIQKEVERLDGGLERLERGVKRHDRGVESLDRGVEKLDRGVGKLDR